MASPAATAVAESCCGGRWEVGLRTAWPPPPAWGGSKSRVIGRRKRYQSAHATTVRSLKVATAVFLAPVPM